jgi:hypothetical protein
LPRTGSQRHRETLLASTTAVQRQQLMSSNLLLPLFLSTIDDEVLKW